MGVTLDAADAVRDSADGDDDDANDEDVVRVAASMTNCGLSLI